MRKLLIFIVFTLFFAYGCSSSNSSKPVKLTTHGRYAMLIFDSTTCHYCRELHHDLKANERLRELASKMTVYFIHVNEKRKYLLHTKVHGNLTVSALELARVYGFRGSTPYIVLTNSRLEPIVTIPGYLKPNMFFKVLKYVLSGAYKRATIEDYMKLH